MLIFHEGLPRSGKSYEAMVRHIFKALREGRPVDAYLDGLNFERIAQAASVDLARVEELLQPLTREQVPEFYKHVRRNALVVLDEAQNFWPNGRQKLDPLTTQAITEHGHLGQDYLLMGQDLRDVHALWRRRVAQKAVFNKLDAIGSEGRYNVTVFKATAPEKFVKVGSSIEKYDPANFGTYKSHVDGEVQTGNYKDERFVIWRHPIFRYVAPAVAVACVVGAFKLHEFFNPQPAAAEAPATVAQPVAAPSPRAQAKPLPPPGGFILELNAKYRPRLAGYFSRGQYEHGVIEWWDGAELRESLTFKQIRYLGATVFYAHGVARVGEHWVTPWPRNEGVVQAKSSTVQIPGFGSSEAPQ